jgi:predicted Rossmann-fold nucleotide-binding protein
LNGYYDTMLSFLNSVVTHEFMGSWQMDLIQTHSDAKQLLPSLVQAAALPTPFQSESI